MTRSDFYDNSLTIISYCSNHLLFMATIEFQASPADIFYIELQVSVHIECTILSLINNKLS